MTDRGDGKGSGSAHGEFSKGQPMEYRPGPGSQKYVNLKKKS